ncbi:hypothetical protein E2C01_032048 [Portunus trituberculatus]|uniref:Uncharacterized protein n=1 Tax=Portunus trituberculatus TaxID=210409 RepID=A0A5B7EZV5_PORTR|nr:hypothetical protein [Portunus trituberculatus]
MISFSHGGVWVVASTNAIRRSAKHGLDIMTGSRGLTRSARGYHHLFLSQSRPAALLSWPE